ncbi:MAG: helix-turn-helix transcriptional regulator [Cellulosilyticaceae bacterium]
MNLKEKLLYLNDTLGISYSKIGERVGIDRTTISKYVNNSREMSAANKSILEHYLKIVFNGVKGE